MQMGKYVTLIHVAGNLLCILDTAQHVVGSTTSLGVDVYGHTFLVCLYDQLHHLVVVVEAL